MSGSIGPIIFDDVLRKRMKNGKVQYLLKMGENIGWVYAGLCDAAEIDIFESALKVKEAENDYKAAAAHAVELMKEHEKKKINLEMLREVVRKLEREKERRLKGRAQKKSPSKPTHLTRKEQIVEKCFVDILNDPSAPYPECPELTEEERQGKCTRDVSMTLDRSTATYKQTVLHCLEVAYSSAVPNAKALNSSKPGDLTYGEINEHQLRKFLLKIRPTDKDFFLDIGMGVGRAMGIVAMWFPQIEGVAGIEIDRKFQQPMKTFKESLQLKSKVLGLRHSDIHPMIGDFNEWSPEFVDVMNKTTIVFAHNTAFSSETNNRLEELVYQLKDGARIITAQMLGKGKGVTRGDGAEKMKTQYRFGEADISSSNYNILSRLDVEPLEMLDNGVSYSCQKKQFWLHTVNTKKETLIKDNTKMKGSVFSIGSAA